MGFWSRLIGYATKEEAAGIRMEDNDPWVITPPRDPANVLRCLPILFPSGGFVYFEDLVEKQFEYWLTGHSVPAPIKIAYGTIWPKPTYYHIPLTKELLSEAAYVVGQEGMAFPTIHLHVHDGKQVLMEWHDAIDNNPMLISSAMQKEKVVAFAHAIGVDRIERVSDEQSK